MMDVPELIESESLEDDQLEYKSVNAHPDSILKDLVAMANEEGGRLIVGISEDDGQIEKIQDVEDEGNPSGLEENLHHQIRDKVSPSLDLGYNLVEYNGKSLIEISVSSQNNLCSLEVNGRPTFPIRLGSTTDYLSGQDISGGYQSTTALPMGSDIESNNTGENYQDNSNTDNISRNGTLRQTWSKGIYQIGQIESLPNPKVPNYSAPKNRLIVDVPGHKIAMFGQTSIEPIQADHSTIRLHDSIQVTDQSDLKKCLNRIDSDQLTTSYRPCSYAIKYGSRQLVGQGLENFLEDSNRIREICDRLTPGNETAGQSPRPIGVLSFPVTAGVGVLELQWDGDSLRTGRSSLHFLLQNVPVDSKQYSEFFDQFGGDPITFEERTHLQLLKITNQSLLKNTKPVTFQENGEFPHQEIVANNPFYESPEKISDAFDIDVPQDFCETLSGINRLSFDVSGGLHPEDKTFRARSIEVLQLGGLINTYIINALSTVEETDADIPDPGVP